MNMKENIMKTPKLFSLIFIQNNNDVLLGFKTRGLGAGLWNGFGGKVEKNETIYDGAKRELREESNLNANLNHVGVVTYYEEDLPTEDIVHIFTSQDYSGEIKESEEMKPIKWFNMNKMPYEKMWPDASSWIPFMLSGEYFKMNITYTNNTTVVKDIEKTLFKDKEEFLKSFV